MQELALTGGSGKEEVLSNRQQIHIILCNTDHRKSQGKWLINSTVGIALSVKHVCFSWFKQHSICIRGRL